MTETMKIRGRLVTLAEAKESTQRLINSHFHNANSARVSIPADMSDDDIIASDYLHQQSMTPEELVRFLHPGAELYGGGHGKVWIQDIDGGHIGDVCYLGTSDRRRTDAWASALKELTCECD